MDIWADDPSCALVVYFVVQSGFGVLLVFGWGMLGMDVASYYHFPFQVGEKDFAEMEVLHSGLAEVD